MSRIGGTEVDIGIGIEATPGTAVAATAFAQWRELSLQGVAEKSPFTSIRGVRNMASNSQIRRKYSSGSISIVPNVEIAPYLFGLALGSVSSGTVSDSAYTHTITVQNANASMKTATIILERGGEVTERYANCVVNSLNLEVSDDYASMSVEVLGGFPDTTTLSESFTTNTEFAYHQYTAKFGTSFSNAAGNSATPLKSFSLNINNNVQIDEAFRSGSNEPVAGGFTAGRLQITGSYSLEFNGLTELNKYKANTLNALIVEFEGALIGSTSTEKITIKLADLILTAPPVEVNVDGIVVLNQEFEVSYDATDGDITVEIVNDDNGDDY